VSQSHQLAAIMFTDIVGYTALMGKDEQKALKLLEKNQSIQRNLIEQYHGKLLKEMADGLMSSFNSVIDAVQCAIGIQIGFREDVDLNIKIGIHLGDVLFKEGDIFGDGVNIASRIEALAQKGEILVSESVYLNVKNQQGIHTEFVREEHLKNVEEPVKIYKVEVQKSLKETVEPAFKIATDRSEKKEAKKWKKIFAGIIALIVIAVGVFAVMKYSLSGKRELVENRITVAHFRNETGDQSLDYLERMTADHLTQGIGQVNFVEVTSVVSENVIDASLEAREQMLILSEKTSANIIVTGVFYKEGNTLIFQPDVFNISANKPLKTLQHIRGKTADPSAILDDLLQRVLSLLAFKFDLDWKTYSDYMGNVPTYDAYKEFKEGWELYIGNYKYIESIERFNKALELDSTFHHAHSMIIGAYLDNGSYAQADSVVRILNQKRNLLTLNERKLLRFYESWVNGDLLGTLEVSREIIEFDADWGYNVGWAASQVNRLHEAEEWFSKIDPDDSWVESFEHYWGQYGAVLHMQGKHEDELRIVNDRRSRFPDSRYAIAAEVVAHIALGNLKSAFILKKDFYATLKGINPGLRYTWIALEFSAHGYYREARKSIEEAMQWFIERPDSEKTMHRIDLFDALYHSEFLYNQKGAATEPEDLQLTSERNPRIQMMFQITTELVNENPMNESYLGRSGILYGCLGDSKNASRILTILEGLDKPYIYGSNIYWQAAVSAQMGQHSRAVALLYDANSQGYPFSIDFHRNTIWEPLRDQTDFIEFMLPKK